MALGSLLHAQLSGQGLQPGLLNRPLKVPALAPKKLLQGQACRPGLNHAGLALLHRAPGHRAL